MAENFKSGFWMSAIGHGALFVLVLSYAMFSDLFKSEPAKLEPFTLLPPPPENIAETPKPPAPEAVEQIKVKPIKNLKEIELPPEPEVAELPEPEPAPEPTPKPEPKPQPKPEKPKPQIAKDADKAKPVPPKRVSAADFFKNRKPPKSPKPPKQKPAKPDLSPVRATQNLANPPAAAQSFSSAPSSAEMGSYESEVIALLRRHWVLPEACAGMDLAVAVSFTINANGKAVNFKIIKSSGERAFDESVERVLKTLTFRSPPRGKPVSLAINFRAEEE
ncbi:MAG: TonB family protein [Opitutales bacterium]|nr:TonB family protein [Opitutales bacterium]